MAHNKPIHFYIRDRLIADWTAWKKNGKREDFNATWAEHKDGLPLFRFIEERAILFGRDGHPDRNNWYWPFVNSVDLRADIRRRLAPDAYRATAAKLIETGQAPLIVHIAQGLDTIQIPNTVRSYPRFTFFLGNAGSATAINVGGRLDFGRGNIYAATEGNIGALTPNSDTTPQNNRKVVFDIRQDFIDTVLAATPPQDGRLNCDLILTYSIPSGHILHDVFSLIIRLHGNVMQFEYSPYYRGKRIAGMQSLVLGQS